MTKLPEAVLFDLDCTLHDRDRSLIALLKSQWNIFELQESYPDCDSYVREFVELDANGRCAKELVFRILAEKHHWTSSLAQHLCADYYARFKDFCVPFAGAREALTELKALQIKIAIVSNGRYDLQQSVIIGCGFAPLVQEILISEKEGLRKPDLALFTRALERLNVKAGNAIFVGDDPISDIKGARAAGMKALLFKSKHFPNAESSAADGVISDYPELLRWLRQ